ncbi:hypothetical protein ACFL6S_16935 [Candidatus Poribacteria bacterium]
MKTLAEGVILLGQERQRRGEPGVFLNIHDSKAHDFSALALLFKNEVKIIRIEKLRFNPWNPGYPCSRSQLNTHAQRVVNIMGGVMQLQIGTVSHFLSNFVMPAYERCLAKGYLPNFLDIMEEMKDPRKRGFRAQSYEDSSINRLEHCINTLAETFDCETGMPIHEYERQHIIYDMSSIGDVYAAKLVSQLLLNHVITRRMFYNEKNNEANLITMIDEGETLFSDTDEQHTGPSNIGDLIRKMRAFGIGLVVANQTYSTLSETLRACASCQIGLPLSSGGDRREFCFSVGLSHEHIDFMLKNLDVGKAIAKKFMGAYKEPMLIAIKNCRSEDINLTDEKIDEIFDPWLQAQPWKPRRGDKQPVQESAAEESVVEEKAEPAADMNRHLMGRLGINENDLKLLVAVARNPYTPVKDSGKNEGLSPNQARGSIAKLVTLKLARVHRIKTKRVGGSPPQYLELTQTSIDELRKAGHLKDGYLKGTRGGGLLHGIVQMVIMPRYMEANGIEAFTEYSDADVVARNNGTITAYEFASSEGPEREFLNMKRDLENGMDAVVFITRDAAASGKLRSEIERRCSDGLPASVDFKVINDFLIGKE